MVKKIRRWYDSLDESQQALVKSSGQMLLLFVALILGIAVFIGCHDKKDIKKPGRAAAAAVNTDADGYALDPDFKPDFVCLRPGQTAMLLEDIEAEARIPHNGDELWTGRVKIEKGSMVVKPIQEKN